MIRRCYIAQQEQATRLSTPRVRSEKFKIIQQRATSRTIAATSRPQTTEPLLKVDLKDEKLEENDEK